MALLTPTETDFIRRQRVARLATVDPSGNPHVIPICYAFDGERVYTPIDEKAKRVTDSGLRRVRNIAAHPCVALVVDQYADDWSHIGYVLIRGDAALLEPGEAPHAHAVELLRERYQQYHSMRLEKHPVIAVLPRHVTSWGPAIDDTLGA